ncbi:molecular chaperone [Volvox carteri f. nagariensis]|uniref:Molecular chaperone n=1 Tax=Volvox carteri f. nagariensis TaxID=3068 RepID=D8TIY1_VOLCA|nr:molecular chaperone [Volvox carteri f. nagariensis]EFJ52445.1 molecular chaperone [Volvox carteri f. nagariensis]|eukprot:XP_002946518.1 molecular chaperone [Volvox carteri f. nagariensis]
MADAGPSDAAGPGPSSKSQERNEPHAARPTPEELDPDDLMKAFFSDLKEVDRDNEVNRILWAFKLNPFEKLNLRFDATPEDVKRQFRKLSLMVHPDKCKHPQASTAFDILGDAQKELLDDEKRESLLKVLDVAKEELRKERRKETKHDNLVRVASLLHEEGRDGIEAEWEKSEEFHERWKMKARDVLARSEWRKRKLGKRLKEETLRLEEKEKEVKERVKAKKEHEKQWENTRDQRVSTWHDYLKGGGNKKSTGMVKPPKLKTNDEEKLYVQRPVGEQHRPPPPKSAGPKKD